MQATRLHDRKVAVAELAKQHVSIGVHFVGLPTDGEVADFGYKARPWLATWLLCCSVLTDARIRRAFRRTNT